MKKFAVAYCTDYEILLEIVEGENEEEVMESFLMKQGWSAREKYEPFNEWVLTLSDCGIKAIEIT